LREEGLARRYDGRALTREEPGERESPRVADENVRIERLFRDYERDPRKQRAWDIENPGNVLMRRELVDALIEEVGTPLEGHGPVLEIGCGHGLYLEELARRGVPESSLHGVDLVDELIEDAIRRVPGADLRVADAQSLPYPDGTFGVVLLFTVLSALKTAGVAAAIVAEAKRVLGPGGALVVYDMRMPSPVNNNVRRMSRRSLEGLMGPNLRVRSLTLLPPLARRLGARAERLYPLLTRLPVLRTHWLAVRRA
jgi:SAM-dependent methyltransferase